MMSLYRLVFLNILFLLLLLYFSFHTLFGSRGVIAKNQLEHEISSLSNELENYREDKLDIEHQVNLLRPNSLDKDMLEEQAKKVLGYVRKKEKIFILEKE